MTLRVVLLAVFFALGTAACSLAETSSVFMEANAKYQTGDFRAAAKGYEEMVGSGKATEAVYFNLGNAYFRLGQKGRAAAAYERALRISPRDEELLWNRSILKSVLPDRIEADNGNILVFWIDHALALVTIDELAVLFSILLLALAAMSFLAFAPASLRPAAGSLRNLAAVLLIVTAAASALKWAQIKDERVAVLDKEVFARYGPSEKETKAFLLHEGAVARVTDQTQEWFYVTLENNTSGWVPKKSCEII